MELYIFMILLQEIVFLVFPVLLGLVAISEPLVELLLTNRWAPAIPYLQIMSLSYLMHPSQLISASGLQAIGLSKVTLRIEVIRKTLEIGTVLILLNFGMIMVALSALIADILSLAVTFYPSKKYLRYSFGEQLSDFFSALLPSLMMYAVVLLVGRLLNLPLILELIIQVIIGAAIYVLICKLANVRGYKNLKSILKRNLKKQQE